MLRKRRRYFIPQDGLRYVVKFSKILLHSSHFVIFYVQSRLVFLGLLRIVRFLDCRLRVLVVGDNHGIFYRRVGSPLACRSARLGLPFVVEIVPGALHVDLREVLQFRLLEQHVTLRVPLGRPSAEVRLLDVHHVALVGIVAAALLSVKGHRREVFRLAIAHGALHDDLSVQGVSTRLRILRVPVEGSPPVVVRSGMM